MKKILIALLAGGLVGAYAFAADVTLEAQFDVTGADLSKSFLTFKGPVSGIDKDTVDVAAGASKAKATGTWNANSVGADKKVAFPAGIQSLVKYGVSPKTFWVSDGFNAVKAADGVITIQYLHRGTAYKIVTDKTGKIAVPGADLKKRAAGVLMADGTNYVAGEFAADHTIAKIDWKKVWDASVPAGSVITKVKAADGKETEAKLGAVVEDVAASATPYVGYYQLTLVGNILNIKGELNFKK